MSRQAPKYPAVYMIRHLVALDGYARTRPLADLLSRIQDDFAARLADNPEGLDEAAQLFLRDTLRRLRHDRAMWHGVHA
ncbi:MAG: hypothetical protein AB7O44_33265 [Hyphomicrobiaceae bacterium]